jgi:hypothetical protein
MIPLAGFLALLDTIIGTLIVAFLGLGPGLDRAIAISFLLGYPMYVLDLLLKRQIAIGLLSRRVSLGPAELRQVAATSGQPLCVADGHSADARVRFPATVASATS